MDIQLYFDEIVYPELEFLLKQYSSGNIKKELIENVASAMCNVHEVSIVGQVADIMGADAMSWFLDKLLEIEKEKN